MQRLEKRGTERLVVLS
uniref:Uncharacterized protein n=1 Tax=Anguilla anguilla TaxID=7936 RepID=A0A0E9TTK7_ANGAN